MPLFRQPATYIAAAAVLYAVVFTVPEPASAHNTHRNAEIRCSECGGAVLPNTDSAGVARHYAAAFIVDNYLKVHYNVSRADAVRFTRDIYDALE